MSLVTIIENKDIIVEKIQKLYELKIDSRYAKFGYILSECLVKQYEMMRWNLNKNSVSKRFYSDDLHGRPLLNAYYQHMYMHNHIALEDELYEIVEAIEKYNDTKEYEQNLAPEELEAKLFRRKMLILEEIIDAFHFILEYTDLIEEHYRLQLSSDIIYNKDVLLKNVTEKGKMEDEIMYMVQSEGPHIITWLDSKQFIDHINGAGVFSKSWHLLNSTHINALHRLNRNFMRKINFKDWKNYPEDFYSPSKFAELNEINRMMFDELFTLLALNVPFIDELLPDCVNYRHTYSERVFDIAYGVYMAKREENIRRQNNDPRYTGKASGEVVGVKA